MEEFRSEIKMMSTLNHPNIVKLIGIAVTPVDEVSNPLVLSSCLEECTDDESNLSMYSVGYCHGMCGEWIAGQQTIANESPATVECNAADCRSHGIPSRKGNNSS